MIIFHWIYHWSYSVLFLELMVPGYEGWSQSNLFLKIFKYFRWEYFLIMLNPHRDPKLLDTNKTITSESNTNFFYHYHHHEKIMILFAEMKKKWIHKVFNSQILKVKWNVNWDILTFIFLNEWIAVWMGSQLSYWNSFYFENNNCQFIEVFHINWNFFI